MGPPDSLWIVEKRIEINLNEQLKLLIELQELDTALESIADSMQLLPRKLAQFENPLKESRTAYEAVKKKAETLNKKKHDKDLELDEVQDRIDKLKARSSDIKTNKEYDLKGDLIVNATGPWSEKVTVMADAEVPIRPSPGVMVAMRGRWHNMILNRLHASGDGDIIVPQRNLSVIGTSSWVVEDPDKLGVPEDHIQLMFEKGADLVPAIKHAGLRAAWSAARPLIGSKGEDEGRELSRTFKCFDHKERDNVEGLVTITGGKAATLRGMAETTVDVVCKKLGLDIPCRTREEVLLPYRAYYN